MTNRFAGNDKNGVVVTPIGIYCYFDFDFYNESCEVPVCQIQSANKRYFNML